MPTIPFGRNKSLFDGSSTAGIEIKADASADLLTAIAGKKPFPSRDIEVAQGSLSFQGPKDLTFKSDRGKVTFKGSANAFAALGVFSDPAKVRALLKADEHVANGLTFGDAAGHRLLVLRWGYDVTGSAKGAMALGAGGAVTLGVEGAREGLYAVVHRFKSSESAAAVLGRAASSWRPPALVKTAADLGCRHVAGRRGRRLDRGHPGDDVRLRLQLGAGDRARPAEGGHRAQAAAGPRRLGRVHGEEPLLRRRGARVGARGAPAVAVQAVLQGREGRRERDGEGGVQGRVPARHRGRLRQGRLRRPRRADHQGARADREVGRRHRPDPRRAGGPDVGLPAAAAHRSHRRRCGDDVRRRARQAARPLRDVGSAAGEGVRPRVQAGRGARST